MLRISKSLGGRNAKLCGKRLCRCLDRVEARAIVPKNLATRLVAERQTEELLHRLGKGAVGMGVVARYDKVFGPQFADDIDGWLLIDIKSNSTAA